MTTAKTSTLGRLRRLMVAAVALSIVLPLVAIAAPAVSAQEPGTCNGLSITVNLALGEVPTQFNDVIMGTAGDDVIAAGDGNDVICAGGGNDTIWGQNGDDRIFGGDGDDKIRGGNGGDVLRGEAGADDLAGGRDNDFLYGGDGDDLKLRGGTGDDYVNGEAGNDLLVAGNGGLDVVEGGDGNDFVTGGPRPDTVIGGSGDDVVKGNKGADQLFGNDGDDELLGGPQPDVTHGGPGSDECNGGTEIDTVQECETLTAAEVEATDIVDLSSYVANPPQLTIESSVNFAGRYAGVVPDDGAANNFVIYESNGTVITAALLPERYDSISSESDVLTAADSSTDSQLLVSNLGSSGSLEDALAMDFRAFMVADTCAPVDTSTLSIPVNFDPDDDPLLGSDFDLPYQLISTPAGSGGFIMYAQCTVLGVAAAQVVLDSPAGFWMVTLVAENLADLAALDRLLQTMQLDSAAIDITLNLLADYVTTVPDNGVRHTFEARSVGQYSAEVPATWDVDSASISAMLASSPSSSALIDVQEVGQGVTLAEAASSDVRSFMVSDSCTPADAQGDVLVDVYFNPLSEAEGAGADFKLPLQNLTLPLGDSLYVMYEQCSKFGAEAAAQIAIAYDGRVFLVTAILASLADLVAVDQLLSTLTVS